MTRSAVIRRKGPLAKLIEQHQATPRYDESGVIFWTCKAGCDCEVPANSVRAAQFEAAHQADVIIGRER